MNKEHQPSSLPPLPSGLRPPSPERYAPSPPFIRLLTRTAALGTAAAAATVAAWDTPAAPVWPGMAACAWPGAAGVWPAPTCCCWANC